MTIKLESPHPFSERILLFGGGGVGKTNAALSIANHLNKGRMFVVEQDYSLAYERALTTDYSDARNKVEVLSSDPEWDSFISNVQASVDQADPETDWIVIDPVSPSWDWVQEWSLETQYGKDLPETLVELKRQFGTDTRGYSGALAEMMNWNLVKKEYSKLYKAIQRWKGHLILTAEAKAIGGGEREDEIKMLYGPIGFKPAGESRLRHVASTTLFLTHPRRGEWQVTTVKDRNRQEMDREVIEDFALDYLVQYGNWGPVK